MNPSLQRRHRNTLAALLGTFAVTASGACSPAASSSVGMSRNEFATQYCALVKPCCEGAGRPAGGCADAAAAFLPATFDGNAAQVCLDAIRASSSSPAYCNEGAALADHNACRSLSTERGSVALGGKCNNATVNTECASSPEGQVGCVYGNGGSICTLQLLGDEGATSCVADTDATGIIPPGASISIDVPSKGTYCDRSKGLHCQLSTGTCVKASEIGGACQYNDYECVSGAYCATGVKECKATLAIGAACSGLGSCGPAAYCDPTSGTERCTQLAANGEACKGTTMCASNFCSASKVCAAGFSGSLASAICVP